MKNLFFPLFALLLFCRVSLAQNYVPLSLDSMYTFIQGFTIKGSIDTQTSYAAYSYDSNDLLIQLRLPTSRLNFTSVTDTVYTHVETQDASGEWTVKRRFTTYYSNGKITSLLWEKLLNGIWVNDARELYYPDANNHDSLHLFQSWNTNGWKDYKKQISIYNANGDKTAEATYEKNTNGEFYYKEGYLYEYDDAHYLIQSTAIFGTPSYWLTYGIRNRWNYGNDHVLNSHVITRYTDGSFINQLRYVYDYSKPDSIYNFSYIWTNNSWEYSSKELFFDGPGIYSGGPDSTHIFFDGNDQVDYFGGIRYSYYTVLENGQVYHLNATISHKLATGVWYTRDKREEWYHVRASVNNDEVPASKNDIAIFPNPCQRGQTVSLRNGPQEHFDVLLFNVQGQLVSRETSARETGFRAPDRSGTYMVLFRTKDRILGVSKLIVSD